MILYSIIPPEVVFNENNEDVYREHREIDYKGQKLWVKTLSENTFLVNRVISTNPRAYLDPQIAPGMVVTL